MGLEKSLRSRREFIDQVARTAGVALLLPSIVRCSNAPEDDFRSSFSSTSGDSGLSLPNRRPENWNPIEFNLKRGLAGAIPETYHASITSADGPLLHIGKHTPYIAPIDKSLVPQGYIALMMGDFTRGYAKHPAAATHWYDWISILKEGSTSGPKYSVFAAWPTGNFMALGGGTIDGDTGKNTIYLAALPDGVKPGDTIRVVGHCNLHGEYVDFITL